MKHHLANIITGAGILSGIIACILIFRGESTWMMAELFLLFSLITDGLDGKVARKYGSTSWGPYLDDIADFINFGIHPGLWIYAVLNSPILAILYILAIGYRLIRFTLCAQNTSPFFAGLPSPAGAVAIFGILFLQLDTIPLSVIGILCITFLTISTLPHVHVMKYKYTLHRHPRTGVMPRMASRVALCKLCGTNEDPRIQSRYKFNFHRISISQTGIFIFFLVLLGILSFLLGKNIIALWQCLGIVYYSCLSLFLSYNSTHDR